jgi:hypothetical protein
MMFSTGSLVVLCHCLRSSFRLQRVPLLLRRLLPGLLLLLLLPRLCCCGDWGRGCQRLFLGPL